MKYIDAEKLVAEINKRLLAVDIETLGNFGSHRVWAYNDVKDLIESLQQEQPEVDLEREAVMFCFDNGINITPRNAKEIARHFYELGRLNARKEE